VKITLLTPCLSFSPISLILLSVVFFFSFIPLVLIPDLQYVRPQAFAPVFLPEFYLSDELPFFLFLSTDEPTFSLPLVSLVPYFGAPTLLLEVSNNQPCSFN